MYDAIMRMKRRLQNITKIKGYSMYAMQCGSVAQEREIASWRASRRCRRTFPFWVGDPRCRVVISHLQNNIQEPDIYITMYSSV